MDWDGFRVFLAVARAGRVSAACKSLGVDHTTVSRRLAAFEHELGAPLFYRTIGAYRLTPQGQSALLQAETMEQAALRVRGHIEETAGSLVGRVRLAMLDEYANLWFGPKLPEFRRRYPGIEVELLVGIQQLDLSRGEADLAVRTPRPRQSGLAAVRLGRAAVGLYASKALAGKRLFVEDVASLRGLPLLVYTPAHHALQAAAWFQPLLAGGSVALVTNSTHTLISAARASLGVAVIPRFAARVYDDLVAVSKDLAEGEMWLVSHPDFRRDPKVRALAEFLREAAKGPGGIDDGTAARGATSRSERKPRRSRRTAARLGAP
jgi:DNA-binding transcriptional LysR family regulator